MVVKEVVITTKSRRLSDRNAYYYEIDDTYIKYHIGLHSHLNPKHRNYHEAILQKYEMNQVVNEFIEDYC